MTFWQRVRRELGRETQPVDAIVRLIILERLVRGGLLLVAGIGLLTNSGRMLRLLRSWIADLNLDSDRGLIDRVLLAIIRPLGGLSPRSVLIIGAGTVLFAALELTEAVGLARRRRWAEYLIVIAGCIGIPFEVREVLHRQTPVRISFLVVNVAIVVYLAWQKRLFGLRGGEFGETRGS